MATDGPDPAPCDPKIFSDGVPVIILYGSSNAIERWVQSVARMAEAKVDWHYSGGRAQVLFLGDDEARKRVENAITARIPHLNDGISPEARKTEVLQRCPVGATGLYRGTPSDAD